MKNLLLLCTFIALVGCDKSNDDHVFTLYSGYQNNRLHVATFDATPSSWNDKKIDEQFKKWFTDDNSKECNKVAELLAKEWVNKVKNNETKFWCEKGRYRK
jgi:hypothetical protein